MSQVASRLRGEGGERGVGKRVVVACAVLTPGILSLSLPSPFASSPHSGEIGARVDQPYGPRQETGDTRRHNGSETFPRMRVWQGDRLPHDTGGPVFHLPYSATVEPYSRVLSPSPLILPFYSRGYTPCTRGRPHRSRRAPIPAYTSSVDTGNRSFVA